MPISVSRNARGGVAIGGELDLASVAELRRTLDDASITIVDMADVEFFDAAALRVLVEVRRQRIADGGALRIANPSAAAGRVLVLVGLEDEFVGNGNGRADPPTIEPRRQEFS